MSFSANHEAPQLSRRRLRLASWSPGVARDPVQIVRLSDSLRDSLYDEVIRLQLDTSSKSDLDRFIRKATEVLRNHLHEETLTDLQQLHNTSSTKSAILIQNLPVDPYVPLTPTDGETSLGKTTFVGEAMLVGFGELTTAKVVGYSSETEYSNPWIHEGFARDSPGSALTKATELSFHQDMSYHRMIPDILGLVCLREGHDKQVKTELVDNRDILALLPDEAIDTLRQPRFQIKTSGWVDSSWTMASEERALITGDNSIHLPVDWENMVGLDEGARKAVDTLKVAISNAPIHSVHFEPGNLLLFSNKRTVHARSPYSDLRFDGGDRVLDRAYFLKDTPLEVERTRMI